MARVESIPHSVDRYPPTPPKSYADAVEHGDRHEYINGSYDIDEELIKETPPRLSNEPSSPRSLGEVLNDEDKSGLPSPLTPTSFRKSASGPSYADAVLTNLTPFRDSHDHHDSLEPERRPDSGSDGSPISPLRRMKRRIPSHTLDGGEREVNSSLESKLLKEKHDGRNGEALTSLKEPVADQQDTRKDLLDQEKADIEDQEQKEIEAAQQPDSAQADTKQAEPVQSEPEQAMPQAQKEIPEDEHAKKEHLREEQPQEEQHQEEHFKDEHPKDEQPRDEHPKDEQLRDEHPKDEQPRNEHPKDEQHQGEHFEAEHPQEEQHQEGQYTDEHSKDEHVENERPQDEQTQQEHTLVTGKSARFGRRRRLRWAPLKLPIQRRLQTFMVLLHTLGPMIAASIFFFFCAIPLFWPFILPYLIYIMNSKAATSGTLNYRSERFRNSSIWEYFAGYFPATLHRTAELPPTRKYLFGYHPHGIISHGAFAAFATEALGFSTLFPGITNTLLTLDSNFRIPLYREWVLRIGLGSVSKSSCENLLRHGGPNGEGMGRAITIVVGGARESLDSVPEAVRLVLNCRKGFVRLAIRSGADLVPVFGFGENELYEQVDGTQHPWIHGAQMLVKRMVGFTVPLFHARGIFNYDVGLLPYRRPVNIVVGKPILVQTMRNPTDEYVNEIHAKYVKELLGIWETWKDTYGGATKTLEIIE